MQHPEEHMRAVGAWGGWRRLRPQSGTILGHFESDHAGAAYAQSYALFRYLFRSHREQLAQLFRDIEREPAGAVSPQRMLELFERRIGPVDLVEREWLRFEQR